MKKYTVFECECCGTTTRNVEGWWGLSSTPLGFYVIQATGEVTNDYRLYCGQECLFKNISEQLHELAKGGTK